MGSDLDDQSCIFCLRTFSKSQFPESVKNNNNGVSFKSFLMAFKRQVKLTSEDERDLKEFVQILSSTGSWVRECEDCWKVMKSVCDVFKEMKVLELKLHWGLWTISKLMRSADREPIRLEKFENGLSTWFRGEGKVDGGEEDIAKLKKVRKNIGVACEKRSLGGFPRVILTRDDKVSGRGRVSSPSKSGPVEPPSKSGPEESPLKSRPAPVESPSKSGSVELGESSNTASVGRDPIDKDTAEGNQLSSEPEIIATENAIASSSGPNQVETREERITRMTKIAAKALDDTSKGLTTPLQALGAIASWFNSFAPNPNNDVGGIERVCGVGGGGGTEPQPSTSLPVIATSTPVNNVAKSKEIAQASAGSSAKETCNAPTPTVIELESDMESVEIIEPTVKSKTKPVQRPRSSLRTIHRCDKCQKTFSNRSKLEEHRGAVHGEENEAVVEQDESDLQAPVEKGNDLNDDGMDCGSDSDSLFEACGADDFSDDDDDDDDNYGADQEEDLDIRTGGETEAEAEGPQEVPETRSVKNKRKVVEDQRSSNEKGRKNKKIKVSDEEVKQNENETTMNSTRDNEWPKDLMTLDQFRSILPNHIAPGRAEFKCRAPKCGYKFSSREELGMHSKIHGGFKCNFCDLRFDFAPDLAFHECFHTSAPPTLNIDGQNRGKGQKKKQEILSCPRCSFKEGKRLYTSHFLLEHLGIKLVEMTCPLCKLGVHRTKKARDELVEHFKNVHDVEGMDLKDIYRCEQDTCPAFFRTRRKLDEHRNQVHGVKFQCGCGNAYNSRTRLGWHHQRCKQFLSGIFSKFECEEEDCGGRKFMTQEDLEGHVKLAHSKGSGSMLQCSECGRKFWHETYLRFHMQRSHGPKKDKQPFQCDQCGKGFKLKHSLYQHSLSHSGPESWPFQCSTCGRKCISQGKLRVHEQVHTKAKSFVCQMCGAAYAHAHNLRLHMGNKHQDKKKRIMKASESD